MSYRKITDAQRAQAVELLQKVKAGQLDLTATDIANQTGIGLSTITAEAKGIGLRLKRPGRPPVLDHVRILELFESGLRVADIQRQLGHSNRVAIDKVVKRYLDEKSK